MMTFNFPPKASFATSFFGRSGFSFLRRLWIVSIISGTIRMYSGVKSFIFFKMWPRLSLMQQTAPTSRTFSQSTVRQNAWWIGKTERSLVASGIGKTIPTTSAAILFWVSMTPLLFPVVPDVNMIVERSSLSTLTLS